MMVRLSRILIVVLLCSLGLSLQAEDKVGLLNKLLAPGPLIDGHKKLEVDGCFECHESGASISDEKCLKCHKEIKQTILEKPSYHSLVKKPCYQCHADHKGRDYDTTKVDQNSFNHKLTGFELRGKHKNTKCSKCHTEKRTKKFVRRGDPVYLGLSNSCIGCHKDDDVHFFTHKYKDKECSTCHGESSWEDDIKFDHDKDTDFKLEGQHSKEKCTSCHKISKKTKTAKYNWPQLAAQKCLSCHEDHHKANLSTKYRNGKCDTCHNQYTWEIDDFNHRVTGFDLKAKHAQLKCAECHKQSSSRLDLKDYKFTGLRRSCDSCHEDIHGFGKHKSRRFGNIKDCSHCHSEYSFKDNIDFNHNYDTRWKITGKHKKLKCEKCHTTLKKGDRSKNPDRNYSWPHLTSKTCENCHKSPHTNSPSKKFREKKCSQCHTTEGWNIFNRPGKGGFNHNTETRFDLTGYHLKLSCDDCHKQGKKQVFKFKFSEKQFCEACHDNVHKKQFSPKFAGKACVTCHTTDDFAKLKPFNHNITRFKLTGEHYKIGSKCEKCHVKTKAMLPLKKPRPARKYVFEHAKKGFCVNCHKNVHTKQFHKPFYDKPCSSCHTTDDFKKRLKFNHNTTRFKLTGEHKKIESKCFKCHVTSKKLVLPTKPPKRGHIFVFAGFKKGFCTNCHANVHKGQFHNWLSNKTCLTCHTTDNFEKRKKFDHDITRFDLKGKHKKVDCFECHTKTKKILTKKPKKYKHKFIFNDLYTKECAICHKDEHNGDMGPTCSNCHNENGWKSTKDFHKDFLLTGVHYTLNCAECHIDNRHLAGLSENCLFCHRKDDVHGGTLPECGSCHSQFFWEVTTFKHSLSTFPLRGAHRGIECSACHSNGIYQGLPSECIFCHQNDAATVTFPDHSQPEFMDCQECHNQFSFESIR